MSYVTVSKGYLAGGYDSFVTGQNNFTYHPEYTWNYEAGMKTACLNNKLIANVVVFYIDIKDKQVTEWLQGADRLIEKSQTQRHRVYSVACRYHLQLIVMLIDSLNSSRK